MLQLSIMLSALKTSLGDFLRKHSGSLLILIISTALTLLLLVWMGFDLKSIPSARMGNLNDAYASDYYFFQALENLVNWPINLGNSLVLGGIENSFGYTVAPYGITLPFAPLYLLSGRNFILMRNLYIISSYVITTWLAFLLIRYLFKTPNAPAMIGGLMLAFSPYRTIHLELAHPSQLCTHYFLLALYGLHRLIDQPKLKWAGVLAVGVWLMLISSGYYAIIFVVMGGCILIFTFFTARERVNPDFIKQLFIAVGITLFFSFPFLAIRLGNDTFASGHSLWSKIQFSASLENLVSGTTLLYRNYLPWDGEKSIFIGFLPIVLSLFIWLWRRDMEENEKSTQHAFTGQQLILLYGGLTLIGYLFALGPDLKVNPETTFDIFMPYQLLVNLPGFSAMRAVVRFALISTVSTSVLSGAAIAFLLNKIKRSSFKKTLISLLMVILFVEFLPYNLSGNYGISSPDQEDVYFPIPFFQAFGIPREDRIFYPIPLPNEQPLTQWLAAQPPSTLVWHYPPERLIYLSHAGLPVHQQPMLNGSGPAAFTPSWDAILQENEFPSQEILGLLRELNTQYVLVYLDQMEDVEQEGFFARLADYEQNVGPIPLIIVIDEILVYSVSEDN